MKTKLLLTMLALVIVVTMSHGGFLGQKSIQAYAFLSPKLYEHTPWIPIPSFTASRGTCQQVTYPATYMGGAPIPTFTDTTTYLGAPWTFTGWCVVDNSDSSASNPCYVYQGIAYYGRCEVIDPGYNQTVSSPPNIPSVQWFHFAGVHLKAGQFLDLADTTPWVTTKGHMAMVIPCEHNGAPDLRLYEGIIDGGVFTMEASPIQYLQQLSDPANGVCVYHFNIGSDSDGGANPDGITDFAVVNVSNHDLDLSANDQRYTSTFSITEGFENNGG